jgi:hypothetical protein
MNSAAPSAPPGMPRDTASADPEGSSRAYSATAHAANSPGHHWAQSWWVRDGAGMAAPSRSLVLLT